MEGGEMLIPQGMHRSGGNLDSEKQEEVKSLLEDFQNNVDLPRRLMGMAAKDLPVLKPCNTYVWLTEDKIYVVFNESRGTPLLNMNGVNEASLDDMIEWIEGEVGWGDYWTLSLPTEMLELEGDEREEKVSERATEYIKNRKEKLEREAGMLKIDPVFERRGFEVEDDLAFVLMPFGGDFDDIYQDHMKPAMAEKDFECKRADDIFRTREVVEDIWEYICRARVVIADLTGRNPNVFYEAGIAHTVGKDVILTTQNDDDIPFNLEHLRYYQYDYTPRGMENFEDTLQQVVDNILE